MQPHAMNVDPSSPFTIHNIPFGVFSTEQQVRFKTMLIQAYSLTHSSAA
jgi:hypothetical protein